MQPEHSAAGPLRRPRQRAARLGVLAALLTCAAVASAGCAQEFGAEEKLCARLVRFYLGLHHPVEVRAAERTSGKPSVRIRYRGTRNEESSVEGVALCRFTEQTGKVEVAGATVDDARLDASAIRAFTKFSQARSRAGGG